MIPRRKPSRKLILGPRALAVISCALAILTSAPLISTSAPLKAAQSISITTPKPIQNLHLESAQQRHAPAITKVDFQKSVEATRRLHVLATVEMLHRWLISEFRPAERTVLAAFVYEPMALSNVKLPILSPHRTWVVSESRLTHEAAFAIYRNLLAPPSA